MRCRRHYKQHLQQALDVLLYPIKQGTCFSCGGLLYEIQGNWRVSQAVEEVISTVLY